LHLKSYLEKALENKMEKKTEKKNKIEKKEKGEKPLGKPGRGPASPAPSHPHPPRAAQSPSPAPVASGPARPNRAPFPLSLAGKLVPPVSSAPFNLPFASSKDFHRGSDESAPPAIFLAKNVFRAFLALGEPPATLSSIYARW